MPVGDNRPGGLLLTNGNTSHKIPTWALIAHAESFDMTHFHGFQVKSARYLAACPDQVPDECGVYAILISRAHELITRLDALNGRLHTGVHLGSRTVIYLGGTSRSLRTRIGDHLEGDARVSTLRMTLGALLAGQLRLKAIGSPGHSYFHFGSGEKVLSAWMHTHLDVAFKTTGRYRETELSLIRELMPALNISDQKRTQLAKELMKARSALSLRHLVTRSQSALVMRTP